MYYWKAIYENGDSLSQLKNLETNEWNKYGDIDRDRLKTFIIYQRIILPDKRVFHRPALVTHLGGTRRLIYRRRTGQGITDGEIKYVIHIVGWQDKIGERNIQQLAFLFANDGHIELMDRFSKDNVLFCPIKKFRPEEME